MHLVAKSGERIELTPLPTQVTTAQRTRNQRVEVAADPGRDPVSTGALVAHAARGFFDLGRRAGNAGAPVPAKGPPPVTFRDEASGALRVVYREIVVRFGHKVPQATRRRILAEHGFVVRRRNRLGGRPGRRVSPGPEVRGRGAARDRQRVDRARRRGVRDAELRLAVLAPRDAADSRGAVAPGQPRHRRREEGRGRRCARGLEGHARQARRRRRGAGRRRRHRPSESQVAHLEEPRRRGARPPRTRLLPARRRSRALRPAAEALSPSLRPDEGQRHPRHTVRRGDRGGGEERRRGGCRAGLPRAAGARSSTPTSSPRTSTSPTRCATPRATRRSSRARGRAATAATCSRRSRTSAPAAGAGSARSCSAPPATTTAARSAIRRAIRTPSPSGPRPTTASSRATRTWAARSRSSRRRRAGCAASSPPTSRHPNRGFNTGTAAAGGADGLHTSQFGGTSSATPLAAGVAALVLSVRPDLTATEARSVMESTCDRIGSGYDASGHSPQFGRGRVNAGKAVAAAKAVR